LKICNILLSNVWGDVDFDAFDRGIGGREGAMLYLSREWAKMGHEIINFVDIKRGKHHKFGEGTIDFVPLNLSKHMMANLPFDVGIAWECPSVFEDAQIRENVRTRICEMQVCHFPPGQMKAAEEYCHYVAALSDWHGDFLRFSGLQKPAHAVVTLPNGVDIFKYPKEKFEEKLNYVIKITEPKFVYSSSPDRGLWGLLKSWKYIKRDFPKAELKIAYGAQNWIDINKWSHGRPGEMAIEIEKLMKQQGVKDIGKIGQGELAKLQMDATAWLYPLDAINATESGCITAVENAAAGNPIITTNCDCMEEEFGAIGRIEELPINSEKYAGAVKTVLTDIDYYRILQERGRKLAESRDWSIIAKSWIELFNDRAK